MEHTKKIQELFIAKEETKVVLKFSQMTYPFLLKVLKIHVLIRDKTC